MYVNLGGTNVLKRKYEKGVYRNNKSITVKIDKRELINIDFKNYYLRIDLTDIRYTLKNKKNVCLR